MHYHQVKSILSPKNGMNLYRGCSHGCIYCDSRSKVYNMNHEFEDIEVKKNSLELLKKTLRNKRKKVMISTGSMSDPYMPVEKRLKYMRNALKLIYAYGHGFTCITKSDLILRDLDLIEKINENTKSVVQMTLTTSDEDLCKVLEPNVCTTRRRVEVLKELNRHEIPTVVWLCPILPFINDTEENIHEIIDYCIGADVKGIICFGMGMTLKEGSREYFYRKLDENFSGLKEKYKTHFKNSYHIPSPNSNRLMNIYYEKTTEAGIMNNTDEIFEYLREFPKKDTSIQTKLF